jgi:hypothetical protein
MKMHKEHKKLLYRYGDIVRTGPNEVMVCDVDVLSEMHSAKYSRDIVYENRQIFGKPNVSGSWAGRSTERVDRYGKRD